MLSADERAGTAHLAPRPMVLIRLGVSNSQPLIGLAVRVAQAEEPVAAKAAVGLDKLAGTGLRNGGGDLTNCKRNRTENPRRGRAMSQQRARVSEKSS